MENIYFKTFFVTLCLLWTSGTLLSAEGHSLAKENPDSKIDHEEAPKFLTRESFVVFLDENGKATLDPAGYNRETIEAECAIDRVEYDRNGFDCGDVGFQVIRVTAFDCNGLSTTTEADVEVRNEIIPTFTTRESFVIFLDENGKATLSPDQYNRETISANCGIDRIEFDRTEFDCGDVGFNVVKVTAYDTGTYSFETEADVEVRNEIIPTFTTRESFVIFLDENGKATLSPDQYNRETISANCGIDRIEFDRTEFDCGDVGFNVIKVTAYDKGTYSFETEADVEVRNEIIPTFTARESFVIFLDENGKATLSPDQYNRETISANCGIDRIEFDRTEFDCGDVGFNVVKVTAYDTGTYSFETEADVEVRDASAPILTLIGEPVIDLDPGSTYTEQGAQVYDNCGASVIIGGDNVNPEVAGTYTITYNAKDGAGNAADQITRIVNVIRTDTEGPAITANDLTAFTRDDRCSAVVESYNVTATDESGVADITFDLIEGTVFEQGITEVTVTATDVLGNSSSATFSVTVIDNVSPTIEAGNISLELDESGEAHLELPNAPMEIFSEDFEDEVPGLDLTELNNWNVTEGNVDVFFAGQFGLPVSNNALELSGNVNGVIESKDAIQFEPGNYRLRLDYRGVTTDAAIGIQIGALLNASVTEFVNEFYEPAEFDFTVTETTSATIRFSELGEEIDFSGTLIDNVRILRQPDSGVIFSVYDNCQVTSITSSKTDFTCDDLGKNLVTITVADAAGNTTSTEIEVDVIDNIAPVAVAQDITVALSPDGTVTIDPRDVDGGSSDNCDLTYSLSKTTFDCSDLSRYKKPFAKKNKKWKKKRENEVVLIVTDASGNSSSATAVVIVVDDHGPTYSQEPITIYVSDRSKVRLTRSEVGSRISDNCAVRYFTLPAKFFTSKDEGLNEVKVRALDPSGNITTGYIMVNVVDVNSLGRIVTMCYKGKTIRVSNRYVQRLIRRGASVGSCNNLVMAAAPQTFGMEEVLTTEPLVALSAAPNPAQSFATITFSSTEEGRAVLTIFNSVKPDPTVLFDNEIKANTSQKVTFDTSDLPGGVYILRLNTAQGTKTMKLLVKR